MVLFAVYLRAITALFTSELSVEVADILGRISTAPMTIWFVIGGTSMLMGIVAAMSIREGGPLRLFVAGVFVSALPFALAFRTPVDGG